MAKARAKSVIDQLQAIEQAIAAKAPAVSASLAPGAKAKTIDKLARLFGQPVPADVRAWFAWHDGPRPNTYDSLIPDTNWMAMSVAQVIETYKFLDGTAKTSPEDIMLPWKSTWIPLFANGGGDHLCYDTSSGAIVTWYHDDEVRPKAYPSFGALIAAIDKGYAKLAAAKGFAGPGKLKWKAVARAPTEAQLAKLPPGAAFTYAADLPMGHRQFICIKLGDDRWIQACGRNLKRAVEHWSELAAKPPTESSGYYHRGWTTWYDFKNYKKTLKQAT
jgi:cell wall assembly regulator SMI1